MYHLLVPPMVLSCLLNVHISASSEWVDPSDMSTYDPVSKTNKNKLAILQDCNCEKHIQRALLAADLHRDQLKLDSSCPKDTLKSTSHEPPVENNVETVYLQRFVSTLLKQFNYRAESELQDYRVTIKLSEADRRKLDDFVANSGVHLNEVDAILTELFVESQATSEFGDPIFLSNVDQDTKDLIKWILISLAVAVVAYAAVKMPLSSSAIVLFLVGTFWHWQHMYQRALAERHAELTKNPEMPIRCQPQRMTWFEGLKAWWFEDVWKGEDECAKYFQSLMVDPIWDVSPTMAFSTMFTQFVTYPLGVLGTNIGNFFASLFRELPPLAILIVLPFLFFVITAVLFTNAGYSFRGIGFAIGPAGRHPIAASQPRQMVEDVHAGTHEQIQREEPKLLRSSSNSVIVHKNSGVEELENSEAVTIKVILKTKPKKSNSDDKEELSPDNQVDEKGDKLR